MLCPSTATGRRGGVHILGPHRLLMLRRRAGRSLGVRMGCPVVLALVVVARVAWTALWLAMLWVTSLRRVAGLCWCWATMRRRGIGWRVARARVLPSRVSGVALRCWIAGVAAACGHVNSQMLRPRPTWTVTSTKG